MRSLASTTETTNAEPVRVYVEQFPNKEIREFHLGVPTHDAPFSHHGTKDEIPEAVRALDAKLVMCPATAAGFTSGVYLKSIRVNLNKAFTWDECIAQVCNVLREFYGRELDVTIQQRERWMDRRTDGDYISDDHD